MQQKNSGVSDPAVSKLVQMVEDRALANQVLQATIVRQSKQLKHPVKYIFQRFTQWTVGCLTRMLPYAVKRQLKKIVVKITKDDQCRQKPGGDAKLQGLSQEERFHLLHDELNKVLFIGVDDALEQAEIRCHALISQAIECGWDVFFLKQRVDAEHYHFSKAKDQYNVVSVANKQQLLAFCRDFKIHCPLALISTPSWLSLVQAIPGCLSLSDQAIDVDYRFSAAPNFSEVVDILFPKVSVVVLTYNNLQRTQACLSSIALHTHYPNFELIVVDNASSDGTVDFLRTYCACHENTTLVLNRDNYGFAKGNNIGIDYAAGDYVVILNNDTYVTEGWLHDALRHFRRNAALGLLGPVTANIDNEAQISLRYQDMFEMADKARAYTQAHQGQCLLTDHISFFCTIIPRWLIDKVGALSEDYSVGLFEDDDYCQKVLQAGYQIGIAEDVFVHHDFSASIGQLKFGFQEELLARNKAIFEKKWGPWKGHRYR